MNITKEHLAPWSFILALLSFVFVGVWFVINRQLGTAGQIALGVAVAGITAGILLDPDRVRQLLSGRQARYGSNALLLVLAFAGILGVINYFVFQNPQTWDLTEDQQFSLTQETKDLLQTLDEPIRIIGFYSSDAAGSRENIEPLLNQYETESDGLVQVEFIDPRQQPLQADQYGVTRDGSIVVEKGEKSELVGFASEREISSSIIRVTAETIRNVYFITGHGERDLEASENPGYSQVRSSLQAKNYQVEELNLLGNAQVPAEADVVVLAGPQRALTGDEVDALQNYLEEGGSLFVLLEPVVDTETNPEENPLLPYLEQAWGIVVHNDVIVDLNSNLPLAGIAFSYGNHPITDRMGNLASFFPSARSLSQTEEPIEGLASTDLVQTGPNSWAESDITGIVEGNQPNFDEAQDVAGPLSVAAAVTNSEADSHLVIFGDSDFAANSNYFGLGNGDLFVNSIDWLAGEEDLIQITPRERTQRTVVPPSVQSIGLIFLVTVILIPGASVGAGVVVWWRRRRRMG